VELGDCVVVEVEVVVEGEKERAAKRAVRKHLWR
jgi:hypothetical protein